VTPATVAPEDWEQRVRRARDDGYRFFDWLGCVDEIGRSDCFRIVLVLRDLDRPAAEPLVLSTELPRDGGRLDSVAGVFPGAGWHEREAAELFGLEFVGGEARRLLLDPGFSGSPLRKDAVLGARAGAAWPGGKEPGESDLTDGGPGAAAPGRRRMVPPGVPEPAVWGERDPDLPAAGADQVAESAVGGRVRRTRR
jgi:NADH-quinone oxidoreductase subunit C